ncbi:heavy metal-associated isoprenylated plant protein [Salix suchowensis]|nr:heavy metal-associated isoprenylated plant protein [Salix suchowensis]
MKQKIVMQIPMNSSKHRTKAMKIAAVANEVLIRSSSCWTGVSSVGIEGTDKVVVIGDEVDLVKLGRCLKKEFGHVMLVSVEEKKKEDDKKKKEEKELEYWSNYCFHRYQPPPVYEAIYTPSQPTCSIL